MEHHRVGGRGGSSLQGSAWRDHVSFCDDRAKKGKKKEYKD